MALLVFLWLLGRKKERTFLLEPKTAGGFSCIHTATLVLLTWGKKKVLGLWQAHLFLNFFPHFCTSCLLTIYFFNFPLLLVISCLPWRVWWSREIVKLAADRTANLNCAHPLYYTQEWAAGEKWHFPFGGALCSDCSFTLPQLSVFALPLLSRLYIFLL